MNTRYSRTAALLLSILAFVMATETPAAACDPPAITQQPQSLSVCDGEPLSFSVTLATMEPPPAAQWFHNDEPILGANDLSYTISAALPGDAGDYHVELSDSCGVTVSQTATLEVQTGIAVTSQPADLNICGGADGVLTVEVDPGPSVTSVVGGTGSSSSLSVLRGNYYKATQPATLTRIEHYLDVGAPTTLSFFVYEAEAETGPYALIALDHAPGAVGAGFKSSNAIAVPLQENHYYIIGAGWPIALRYYYSSGSPAPHPRATAFGQSLKGFQAAYADPPPPNPTNSSAFAHYQRLTTALSPRYYQWFHESTPINGATGPSLTILDADGDDAGAYHVDVSNTCGDLVSSAAALVTVDAAPQITTQPQDAAACFGAPATLSVVATGAASYQWRREGAPIAGATSSELTFPVVTPADAGEYDVVVSNTSGCGSAPSQTATLTVNSAPPVITQPPVGGGVCGGSSVTLRVETSAVSPLYQWRKDGVAMEGQTSSTLTISPFSAADVASYDVQVTNGCGMTVSPEAALTLAEPPALISGPTSVVVCAGEPCVLGVSASGAGLTYQWRRENVDLPGENAATLSIAAVDGGDVGAYSVVVSSACSSLVAGPARIDLSQGAAFSAQPQSATVAIGEPAAFTVALDPASFPGLSETVGGISSSATGARIRGNVYAAERSVTLTRIEQYLSLPAAGAVTFFVYEAQASGGPYSLVHQQMQSASAGTGFKASGAMTTKLKAGRWYIIGAAWPGGNVYYWQPNGHPSPVSFGQSIAGYAAGFQTPLPANPAPNSSLALMQRLTTTDDEASLQWRRGGVAIPGATSATLTIPSAGLLDRGWYDCVVQSACGESISEAARLTVRQWVTQPGANEQPTGEDMP